MAYEVKIVPVAEFEQCEISDFGIAYRECFPLLDGLVVRAMFHHPPEMEKNLADSHPNRNEREKLIRLLAYVRIC
jgi:hypothetical protein